MTAQRKDIDRKVVPRWSSLAGAGRQGELSSLATRVSPAFSEALAQRSVLDRTADWLANPSPSFAADLVATALVLGGNEEATRAAEFLLSADTLPLATKAAARLLGRDVAQAEELDPFNMETARAEIRRLKRATRVDPRSALMWAELARCYAAMAQAAKASAAMDIALSLFPSNRFLLRSAARLSLHLDDPDRAHRLVERSGATVADPWLVAAEIALAPLAGRTSRLRKHGNRLLASGQFGPQSLSELASALGTEALGAGSVRQARRLFKTSLDTPTENAVAQAQWAARREQRIEFNEESLKVQDSYEARAVFFARLGDTEATLENAWQWLREQPFAAMPAIFGSYRAALARRYEESRRFAEAGLVANPDEFLLRNNLVFALASADEVDAARRELDLIEVDNLDRDDRLVHRATSGLVAFREGEIATGRALYEEMIRESKDATSKAIAAILLAREELRALTPAGSRAREAATRLIDAVEGERLIDEDVAEWLKHVDELEPVSA